ncbi:MAG: hypothetical protein C4562_00425 [Actinobacteria bacterium]|nr:MAG: hypothetical protein C4562_00425 [Actinomycetota bacterium]
MPSKNICKKCKDSIAKLEAKKNKPKTQPKEPRSEHLSNIIKIVTIISLVAAICLSLIIITQPKASQVENGNSISSPKPGKETYVTTEHFLVWADGEDNPRAQLIAEKAEEYYKEIPSLVGLPAPDVYGLIKIKIYLFSNKDDYILYTRKPKWSEGFSDYQKDEIYLYQSENLFISVLPHEIQHLILKSFVNSDSANIAWLDEGLALFIQLKYDPKRASQFKPFMAKLRAQNYFPIKMHLATDVSEASDQNKVNLWYSQSLSMTSFLLERFGEEKFCRLLLQVRKKKTLEKAIMNIYRYKNYTDFQRHWLDFLKKGKHIWEI